MGKVVVETERCKGKWPLLVRQATLIEETPGPFYDGPVRALDDAVVLVTICVGLVMPDAFVFAGCMELQGSVTVPMKDFLGAREVVDALQDVLR